MSFFQKGNKSSRSLSRAKRGIGVFTALTFIAGIATLAILPTPYLIERPGPTYDVLGEISGEQVIKVIDEPSYDSEGRLDILTVSIIGRPERTPSWFEIVFAWLDGSQKVVPVELLYPPGQTSEQFKAESSAMMEVSQQDAIAAALSYLDYDLSRVIYIAEVSAGAAASGKLIAADFVVSVNDVELTSIEQLRTIIGDWDEAGAIEVTVSRNGELLTEQISPVKDAEGNYRLGILVGYKYDFPIDIELQLGDVGGPSGGMMFALGIIDRLGPVDITGGLHISGTGTIQESGEVGPIGGIVQKLYGARSAGATVFLAPAGNCPEIVGNEPAGLTVVKIEKLRDAIRALEIITENKDLATLPRCTK
jgi:PDZ domain-containing protein